jgi:magnesium-transporting ATPase (P-type)
VVTGEELEAMNDDELATSARTMRVFARVAPEHKLRLVRELQRQNHVVAMTGDGVNDAPALKQANIGVAMGIAGTSVSKEAADMVLADDNFASIAAAVEEGRRVYDNLIKSLAFVLPTNIGEALIILIAVGFFPVIGGSILMPMLPVQILWINLVATVTLALPLAFESKEPGVMQRPPRDPSESILNSFVLFRTVLVALLMAAGAIFLFMFEYGEMLADGLRSELALARAQTAAVTTVVLFQIFYLTQCRSLVDSVMRIGLFSNPYVYLGIALLVILQLAFVYVPAMNTLFGSAPISLEGWVRALLVAMVVLPVISIEKWWRRRQISGSHAVQVRVISPEAIGTSVLVSGTTDVRRAKEGWLQ